MITMISKYFFLLCFKFSSLSDSPKPFVYHLLISGYPALSNFPMKFLPLQKLNCLFVNLKVKFNNEREAIPTDLYNQS